MFLTKSHFCTKQVWPKRRQFSKEPRKQKSWDTLRILGPHYYKKSAGSLLQKKEKKCKNKKSKSGSVVKLTSRVFFSLRLLGGPLFYHVVDVPSFILFFSKKPNLDFPFFSSFSQYVSVVKRFFTTPKYITKKKSSFYRPKERVVVLQVPLFLQGGRLCTRKSSFRISGQTVKIKAFPFTLKTGKRQFAIRSQTSLHWKIDGKWCTSCWELHAQRESRWKQQKNLKKCSFRPLFPDMESISYWTRDQV